MSGGETEWRQFVSQGYGNLGNAHISSRLRYYLHAHPGLRAFVSKFDSAVGPGRVHSSYDLFGINHFILDYINTPEGKHKLENYLHELFYKKNPYPEVGLKIAFTHLLTSHGLKSRVRTIPDEDYLVVNTQVSPTRISAISIPEEGKWTNVEAGLLKRRARTRKKKLFVIPREYAEKNGITSYTDLDVLMKDDVLIIRPTRPKGEQKTDINVLSGGQIIVIKSKFSKTST